MDTGLMVKDLPAQRVVAGGVASVTDVDPLNREAISGVKDLT
jgi:hypothetical protein